jgi:hypothetical protein
MLIQSQLPDEPEMSGKSCIWKAFIGNPSVGYVDTIIPFYGSAWIDKTATSTLMDFAWYQMLYQKNGDTVWVPARDKVTAEKHDELLFDWNTHSLTPGNYLLKMILCDNTPDSNKVEAVKGINLLPKILSIENQAQKKLRAFVYPNPVNDHSRLSFYLQEKTKVTFLITDIYGKNIYLSSGIFPKGENNKLFGGFIPNTSGIYFLYIHADTIGNAIIQLVR